MKLQELVDTARRSLEDESVRVKRAWEDIFRYTLSVYPADTPLETFDLPTLADRLMAAGLHRPLVEGYVRRWRELIEDVSDKS